MPWNDDLDGQPLEIARSEESSIRVIAGPGTGKTRALIRRLARILEQGVDPRSILLVTFTRVSAADLNRELNRLGLPQGQNVIKGTLHSISFSILNRRHVLDFTHRVARPLLEYEERFLLEDLSKYGEFGTIYDRKDTLHAFEAAWARAQDQQPGWPTTQRDQSFQIQLEEWLRFHRGMLIGEIIPLTLRYLRSNPNCPELNQFRHVLVDEYQDLNRAEQSLIDLFAGNGAIAIVGDQDQAIYESLRYARPEGIVTFNDAHQGTHDYPLELSHRCPNEIVILANSLIGNNQRRAVRNLIPIESREHIEINNIQWAYMEVESAGIAQFIALKIQAGQIDPGNTLVLCPRRQFGYQIRDNLRARNIDAHSYFDEEPLDGDPKVIINCEAQQSFALLTLLVNPDDLVALRAWLGFGHINLRSNEYKRVRDYCALSGLTVREVLNQLINGDLLIHYTKGIIERYRMLNQRILELNQLPPNEAFDILFPSDVSWSEPFRFIYYSSDHLLNLIEAYELLITNITQPGLPSTATFVRIMSLYKSKGLTADHVFIPGCVEGLIPSYSHDQAFEEERRYHEEQRRLFYVAITRAKKSLTISSTSTLPRALTHKWGVPVRGSNPLVGQTIASTFINELGNTFPQSVSGEEWLSTIIRNQ
jgi:DNA helicase II / ATP-dependent DNA helicase PcrA